MEMNRETLIQQLKGYFNIKELVCPHVYQVFGELAWGFFREDYLETILFLRRHFGVKMFCNYAGLTQRGVRCNMCDLVRTKIKPYPSGHVYGAQEIGLLRVTKRSRCDRRLKRLPTCYHTPYGLKGL